MNRSILFLSIIFISLSCGRAKDKTHTEKTAVDTTLSFDPNSPSGLKAQKEEALKLLINASKIAMDSIDASYASIRSSSRLINLSLEEREDVNEALQQMNTAKELIVLQTQSEIIEQLHQKTNSLKAVIEHINKTSGRLNNIAATISKVSKIIEKTTNLLASGFAMGIIKPKIEGLQN